MATQKELTKMNDKEREAYLIEVLQRKIIELKNSVKAEAQQEHHHGPEFQRGMSAGFISGLGFAVKVLKPGHDVSTKILEVLEEYNSWAQEFNRQDKRNHS